MVETKEANNLRLMIGLYTGQSLGLVILLKCGHLTNI